MRVAKMTPRWRLARLSSQRVGEIQRSLTDQPKGEFSSSSMRLIMACVRAAPFSASELSGFSFWMVAWTFDSANGNREGSIEV
jgi:hypothetical protein